MDGRTSKATIRVSKKTRFPEINRIIYGKAKDFFIICTPPWIEGPYCIISHNQNTPLVSFSSLEAAPGTSHGVGALTEK